MGGEIRMADGTSRSTNGMLSGINESAFDAQREDEDAMSMTQEERLARLEGRVESISITHNNLELVLSEIRQELKIIHQHAVRIDFLEKRDGETRELLRNETMTRITDHAIVCEKISVIEPGAALNSHSRLMLEKLVSGFVMLLFGALMGWVFGGRIDVG